MEKENLVFTGGGTAGHVMPCVALIEQLKGKYNIHYVGSAAGMEKQIIGQIGNVNYHEIECVKFARGFKLKNLLIPFKLIKGVKQSKRLLKELKPKAVFSKGGYVALPVALSAKCPLISHESDRSVGLANKLTKRKSLYFCCAYEETAKGLKNGVYTGLPIRQSLFKPKSIKEGKPALLIIGGSLGAKAINECVTQSIDELLKRFSIIHITGKGKTNENLKNKNGYTQIEFCSDMGSLYSKADLALSRGGATALFELTALKIPSLIIPLKKGSRGDQVENAEYFSSKGLCHALDESLLTPQTLLDSLNATYADKTLKSNLDKAKNLDGTSSIVGLINQAVLKP